MDKSGIMTGVLMDESHDLSLHEICQIYHITEDLLRDMIEYGLFQSITVLKEPMSLNVAMQYRLHQAVRLHEDLELNVAGVVLALELLDELEQVRAQLHVLQHQMS